ncbi:MAG: Glutathione-dependent formaldehyde-activating [Sphingomonas bacterium]|uniref:GFA family protein n=1 Tax=Sphingomonas bacterium TaxID=1895847 RepID=UPI00261E09AB|nr:GFA family protein [Sphingomonas bacterium]MDB5703125.1 Glutathione-dependent formaldehyde-activating [Sphingomonas bacterium]
MAEMTLPMEGGCRCGKLRFRVSKPPMLTLACHCTGCQKMSASAYSLTVVVPSDGFEVTQGEPVIGGLHGEQGRHHHCDWCKSWVFTRIHPEQGFLNVRATMLDDPSWFVPFVEVYKSEALPWATTPAKHSYETFPEMADYPTLLGEFAASRG